MSANSDLQLAIAAVPAGQWAVGVSGGADSVALLTLLKQRADLSLHVVHLNHELRGADSDGDADFVAALAERVSLPATIVRRSDVKLDLKINNKSASLRQARLAMYADVVDRHHLHGVLLAHHQDDQIETVLHRLLRGSGYRGLCGMAESQRVAGVELRRPLLNVPREDLRQQLRAINQSWREDSSNAADTQRRNRLRKLLAQHEALRQPLLRLMSAMQTLKAAVDESAARWPSDIAIARLNAQPPILREQSARNWLSAAGVPSDRMDASSVACLLTMIDDAASPARITLPGGVGITRRRGMVSTQNLIEK